MPDEYIVSIDLRSDPSQAIRGVEQVQTKLKGIEGSARQGFGGANREAGMLRGGLNNLETAAIGFGTALVAQVGINGVMQLRALGEEALYAQRRFEALVGGPELIGAAMEGLREKTGGVITDMQLQTDAISLMMTGVAADAGEAGDLIALGLKLGGQQGVEDLGRALRNMSPEMLDNIGISKAAVSALSQQYRDAGMDATEAFARATIEIGQSTVERLGDAADAGITEWGRMVAYVNNTALAPGGAVFDIGETMAGTVNQAIDTLELIREIEELNQVRTGMDTGQALIALLTGAQVTSDQPDGGAMQRIFQWKLKGLTAQVSNSVFAQVYDNFGDFAGGLMVPENAQRTMVRDRTRASLDSAGFALMQLQGMAQGNIGGFEMRGRLGEQVLFSEADARQAGEIARQIESIYEMARTHPDLVSEEDLANVERWADEGRQWRDYIEAGADALAGMTAPQLFGQEVTNPLLAGLGESFIDRMRGTLDEGQMQSLQDALGLRTGAETAESLAWRDEGLTALEAIYREYGEDAALTALESYEAGARAARAGNETLPDPLAGMGYFMAAPFGGGEERPVPISALTNALPAGFGRPLPINAAEQAAQRSGEGAWRSTDPMTDMLTSVEDLSGKIGDISGQLELLPGAMAPATSEWSKQLETAGALKTAVDTLTGTNYKLRISWEAMDMTNVPPLMREVIRQEMAAVVRANGGVAPGSIQRTRD